MAYSISGVIYDQYESPVPNCFYQFLFINNNNELSSPTTWSEIKQADQFGYYSADILDGSILTTNGTFNTYDEVVVVCWIGDSTRSEIITECSDWVHPIIDTNKEITIQNIKIYPIQSPEARFINLPPNGIVDSNYNIINTSLSNWSTTEVSPFNTIFYQHCEFKNIPIFNSNCIASSKWEYGIGPDDIFPGKHDTNHSWHDPGIFNVTLTITNNSGLIDSYSEQIIIKYTINVDFDYLPNPPHINDSVNFTNTSNDIWNRVSNYRWEFFDGDILAPPTDTYDGNYSFSPNYVFSNQPDRCVNLIAFWNDGIENTQTSITKCLAFIPIADFEKIDTTCSPTYRDRSVAGLSPKIYYWWSIKKQIDSGWKEILSLEGEDAFEIQFHFPSIGNYQIWHKVKDSNDLTDEIIKNYDIKVCPVQPGGSGGGGGVRYYSQRKKEEILKAKATLIKIKEKKKVKLKLKLIQTERINYEI